jgi:hypothetical protein
MLHSEHMLDAGGALKLNVLKDGTHEVVNDTHLTLEGAGVIGPKGAAWIGTLSPGAAVTLTYHEIPDLPPEPDETASAAAGMAEATADLSAEASQENRKPKKAEPWLAEREKSEVTASKFPPEVLNIRHMVRLAQNTVKPGEIRLVAWTSEEVPGVRIEPVASQARHASVIIAHLRQPPDREPTPDVNARVMVERPEAQQENQ